MRFGKPWPIKDNGFIVPNLPKRSIKRPIGPMVRQENVEIDCNGGKSIKECERKKLFYTKKAKEQCAPI